VFGAAICLLIVGIAAGRAMGGPLKEAFVPQELVVPHFAVTNRATYGELFDQIERATAETGNGVRLVYSRALMQRRFDRPWEVTNINIIALLRGLWLKAYWHENIAVVAEIPLRPSVEIMGVYGWCLDESTGTPVTNAAFRTCYVPRSDDEVPWKRGGPAPIHLPAEGIVRSDGFFVLALPYYEGLKALRGTEDYPVLYMKSSEAFAAFEVSAPGYHSRTNVLCVDRGPTTNIRIKLRRVK
jgi:hypothetical protein